MISLYRMGWLLARSLGWLLFGFKPVGADRVPKDGPVIFARNHQSYLDPPLVGSGVRRPCHFFAKRELFDVAILGPLIRRVHAIPVRRGVYDPASLSRVRDLLGAGGALVLFPEGTRGNGIEFLPPKPGVGMIARQIRVPIVPAYLRETKNLWRALRFRRMRVYYGDPIPVDEIERFPDTKEGYRALAAYVMEHIGLLKVVADEGKYEETSSVT
jgi:1-acyl-sn-glycerol-3-phosphate acyltransferase